MQRKEPMSDAERQRLRRQRLRELDEKAKYAPEALIAVAIRELAISGDIGESLLADIIAKATSEAKKRNPDLNIILQKYIKKQIETFFNP